ISNGSGGFNVFRNAILALVLEPHATLHAPSLGRHVERVAHEDPLVPLRLTSHADITMVGGTAREGGIIIRIVARAKDAAAGKIRVEVGERAGGGQHQLFAEGPFDKGVSGEEI